VPTITVITAADRPQHLEEVYASIAAQTADDWEWLVVAADAATIAASVADDPRVRLLSPPDAVRSEGPPGWKRFAVAQAAGTHLLELDQHDLLMPEAVASLVEAFSETGASFVYSDFALLPVSGRPAGYEPEYGWVNSEITHKGQRLRVVEAFDPNASSLHHPSYSPSHGLAWTRKAYDVAGGHLGSGTADTHDLVCRTYLSGIPFHHIGQCLVLSRQHAYRGHDYDAEMRLSNTHVYDLIGEWSKREGLALYDLGAAHNPAPGFQSVDLQDAEINCDIRFGLPLPDGSAGCVRASDFLEHMNGCPTSMCAHGADGVSPRCAVGIMNEIYRVLAPGGWLVSRTPSTEGRGAFQDPTHVSYWNPNSFWYYTRREQARFVRGITCRFQGTRIWQSYPDEWHKAHNILYVHADLVALKGQRQAGICEI
jgi:O-antigen biosynthesis protein